MLDVPTEEEMQLVETFYEHWNEVTSRDHWTCDEIRLIFPTTPRLKTSRSEDEDGTRELKSKPRRSRGKTMKKATGESEALSPESEDGDEVDEVSDKDGGQKKAAKGKGKARAQELLSRDDAESEHEMDVDTSGATGREIFLRREKGQVGRDVLFEVPTRVEGKSRTSVILLIFIQP